MGVFGRSWKLTKVTFSVMKKEKELFLFPILASVFSLLFLIALLFPTILIHLFRGEEVVFGTLEYVLLFVSYFGLAFIATFFNVCVVYTAAVAFSKKPAEFGKTIRFAFSKIHLIFLWSLVAATVGLILKIIESGARNAKGAGRYIFMAVSFMFGMAWSIATIFVIPGLVYNNLGPFAAIKKSVQVLRKTWGEYLVKAFGMGLTSFLFAILGIVLAVPIVIVGIMAGPIGLVSAIVLIVSYFVVLFLTFGIANQIFDTALFAYAETGNAPAPYSTEMLKNTFKSGKRPGLF